MLWQERCLKDTPEEEGIEKSMVLLGDNDGSS
jgi:hypothetical protein